MVKDIIVVFMLGSVCSCFILAGIWTVRDAVKQYRDDKLKGCFKVK